MRHHEVERPARGGVVHGATIHILRAVKFPDLAVGEWRGTKQKRALKMPDCDVQDEPATTLTMLGLSAHPDFDRLSCDHEALRRVDARWKGQPVTELIIKRRFLLFRNRSRPDLLMATGNGDVVRGAMRALKGPDLEVAFDEIDVRALRKALERRRATTSAAYFSELKIRKVKSAMLYGDGVDQSEDFGRLDDAGILTGIQTETFVDGATEKFLLMRDLTVCVYRRHEEQDVLAFGLAVKQLIEELLPRPTTKDPRTP